MLAGKSVKCICHDIGCAQEELIELERWPMEVTSNMYFRWPTEVTSNMYFRWPTGVVKYVFPLTNGSDVEYVFSLTNGCRQICIRGVPPGRGGAGRGSESVTYTDDVDADGALLRVAGRQVHEHGVGQTRGVHLVIRHGVDAERALQCEYQ